MTKDALRYFHRMRAQGFSIDASRNSTLIMFTKPAEFVRRMRRYPLVSTMEHGITRGTEAEAIRAMDQRFEQIKRGGDLR